MSTNIDEKVVEMRFDNKNFEANAKQSLSTLEKLKEKLKFKDATKGLENIENASKKVNLSSTLGKSIEAVQVQFSTLQIMGITAISRLTNAAITAGKRITTALTVTPIKTGFQEYETQINAVQTILANTSSRGTTLEQVNAALDELNHYADKTIYNFTEMTRNIGTFTAAGVDLETSVSAIQGIANLAAVSGSTSQQASTAMYQLSQALAAGTVKLMDWNSVVNAGMGGQVFQDALKETARLHGIAIDQMIEDEGSFRETLSKGWLSSEILTETLAKFTTSGVNEYLSEYTGLSADAIAGMREQAIATGDTNKAYREMAKELAKTSKLTEDQIYDLLNMSTTAEDAATKVKTFSQLIDTTKEAVQSGWTQTWEILIGDFEEAKSLFTEISDALGAMIQKSSDSRNKVLESAMTSNWKQFSKQVEAAGVSVEQFQNDLIEAGKSHGKVTDEMIADAGSFENSLKRGWLSSDIVLEVLDKYTNGLGGFGEATEDANKKLEELQKVVNRVILGDFGNGAKRVEALTAAGYDYAEVQSLVNTVLAGGKIELDSMSDAQLKNIGLTEDQIATLRELATEARKTNTPLNELIENLNKPSGRELLIDTFRIALTKIGKILGAIKTAWTETFNSVEGTDIYSVIEKFHSFVEGINLSTDSLDKFTRAVKGFFSLTSLFSTFSLKVFQIILTTIKGILGLTKTDILGVLANVGDAIVNLRNTIFNGKQMDIGIAKISEALIWCAESVGNWINSFWALPQVQEKVESFNNLILSVVEHFKKAGQNIAAFVKSLEGIESLSLDDLSDILMRFYEMVIKNFIDFGSIFDDAEISLESFLSKVKEVFSKSTSFIGKAISEIIDFMIMLKDKINSEIGFGEIFTVLLGSGLLISIKKMLSLIELLLQPIEAIKKISSGLTNVLNSFSDKLKAEALVTKTEALLKIAEAVALLAISLIMLSKADPVQLLIAASAITVLMAILTGITYLLSKLDKVNNFSKGMSSILAFAASIFIVSLALKKISDIPYMDILKTSAAIVGAMLALALASGIINKFGKPVEKGAKMILALSAGVYILSKAFENIATISKDSDIETALGIIVSLIVTLGGIFTLISLSNLDSGKALAVIAPVLALMMLIKVFDMLKSVKVEDILENLKSLGIIFALYAALMFVTSKVGSNAAKGGIAILAMVSSLLVLSLAIKMIGDIPQDQIDRAMSVIISVFVMYGLLLAASKFAGNNIAKAGLAFLAAATSLLIIVAVLVVISHIPIEDLANTVLVVSFLGVILALIMVATSKYGEGSEKVIAKIGTTLAILAAALVVLSFIDTSGLLKAGLALAGVTAMLAILMLAAKDVKGSLPVILALTLSLVAMGGILYALSNYSNIDGLIPAAVALGILMLALVVVFAVIGKLQSPSIKALAALVIITGVMVALAYMLKILSGVSITSDTIAALAAVLITLAGAFVVLWIGGSLLTPLTPTILALSAAFLVFAAGCLVIAAAIYVICAAFTMLSETGQNSAESIKASVAAIVSGIVMGLVEGLIDGIGLILEAVGTVASSIWDGFCSFFGIESPSKLMMSGGSYLVQGVAIGMESESGTAVNSAYNVSSKIQNAMNSTLPNYYTSGSNMMQGLTNGFQDNIGGLESFAQYLPTELTSTFSEYTPLFESTGAGLSNGVLGGFLSASDASENSFGSIAINGVSKIKEYIPSFSSAGSDLVSGFVSGIRGKISEAANAAAEMAKAASDAARRNLQINSPSRVFMKIGEYVDEGMIKGLENYANKVGKSAEGVGGKAVESVTRVISGISSLINDGLESDPTIKPILDLSQVESEANRLNAMLSRDQAMSISSSRARINDYENQNGNNSGSSGATFTFTQINNSPKALNRIEIYRQTKNQISAMKEVVSAI